MIVWTGTGGYDEDFWFDFMKHLKCHGLTWVTNYVSKIIRHDSFIWLPSLLCLDCVRELIPVGAQGWHPYLWEEHTPYQLQWFYTEHGLNLTCPNPDVGQIVHHLPKSYFELITNDGETKTRLPAMPSLPEDRSHLWDPCMVIVDQTTVFFAGEKSVHNSLQLKLDTFLLESSPLI